MRKTRKLVSICVVGMMALLVGCNSPETAGQVSGNTEAAENGSKDMSGSQAKDGNKKWRVALVTASGGLGDRSFNDTAWIGFQKAEQELGAEVKVVEPQSVSDYPSTLTAVADGGYDFIMAVGNDWVDTLNTVAPKYPEIRFAGVNVNCQLDNVSVAKFSDFEAGFMAGALAGMMTKTGTVGYLGGMDVPAIQRFYVGYEEGAKYVNPDVNVISAFIGSFADPGKGKEFALQLISQKADVIYHGAGKSGEGLFDAIKDAPDGYYAIGCDSDQDYIVEGRVLGSTLKRVDVAAYSMIEAVMAGTLQSGDIIYNLENSGIGFSEMKYTKDTTVPKEVQDRLGEIEKQIISGEIKITDVFDTVD